MAAFGLLLFVLSAVFFFCGLNAESVLGYPAPGFYLASLACVVLGAWLFTHPRFR